MKKIKDFLMRPPLWFFLIIALIGIASTIGGTLILTQDNLISYAIYGFICLAIMVITIGYCIFIIIRVRKDLSSLALTWSENKPFFNRLFREYGFRAILFSIGSFAINIAFAIYNGSIAVVIGSIWFGALAAYYVLLIILRGAILIYHARRKKAIKNGQEEGMTHYKDTRVYGICGIFLTLLPIAISFAILQMVRANDSFVHSGVTIYIYAIYAFYKIIISIYNFIKTRSTKEMTIRASKNINLADAMMSILALQTAMFREFDTAKDVINIISMNAITGAVVCGLTAIIGIFMIINAIRIIKRHRVTGN